MKKKLFPILLLVLALVFVGCSTTQLEFWTKSQEASKWAATTVKGDMNMEMKVDGETVKMVMALDGFSNTKDTSSYVNMSMDIDAAGEKVNFDDVKIVVKDNKVYLSKNYITQLLALSGVKTPDILASNDVEYITFTDSNEQTQLLLELSKKMMAADQKEVNKWLEDVAKDTGFDVELTKKGDTYSIDLDEKEVLALAKNIILTTTSNLDALNEKYGLNIPAEDLAEVKANMDEVKAQLDELIPIAEAMVKGNVKLDYTFGKDKINEKLAMNMSMPVMGDMSMNMTMNMESGKAKEQPIATPEKVLELTEQDLMSVMVPQMVLINKEAGMMVDGMGAQTPCKVIVKNNKTFVPAKATLGALGEEVIYNAQAKKVGITVDGNFKALNVITEKGTSYISLDELKGLGYTVTLEDGNILIQ